MNKMKKYFPIILSFIIAFMVSAQVAMAQVPTQAPHDGVYDETGLVTQSTRDLLGTLNKQLEQTKTKPQIAVLVVKSLNNQTIESLALETARHWKIGFSDTKNGALFVVSINDRKMRLETSDNLAQYIPDTLTKQLTDLAKADFREDNYNNGIKKVVEELATTYLSRLDEPETLKGIVEKKSKKYQPTRFLGIDVETIAMGIAVILGMVFLSPALSRAEYHQRRRRGWYNDFAKWDNPDSLKHHHSSHSNNHNDWSGGGFSGGGSSNSW